MPEQAIFLLFYLKCEDLNYPKLTGYAQTVHNLWISVEKNLHNLI